MMLRLTALFILITLLGCSSVQIGMDFDIRVFESKATVGETSQKQVLDWLGKPKSTGISQKASGTRLEEWNYYYGTGRFPSMSNAKLKILQIRFNKKDGVLHSYNWSDSK